MKRKYFSALLMASLALASTSMVTSCKDYDDDINGLKQEISKNATTLDGTVAANKTALEAELATLKTQQSTLEKSLENAQTTLNAAIEAAKTDANKYADVQAAAAQQAAIAAAKANVDSAVATIEDALDAANKRIDEVKATSDANASKIAALLEADKELENAIAQVKAEAAQAASNAKDAADKAQAAADKAQTTADAAAAAAAANATSLAQVSKDLETVKANLQNQISALGELVAKNITDIADNKAAADAQFASVTKLIEANQTAIEGLKKADAALDEKIQKNSDDLAALAKIVSANKTACDANLESAKDYADAQVAQLKTEILTALAQKADQEKLDATNAKLDSVATELGQAKLEIAGAVAKIAANQTAIEKVEKYIGNMDSLSVEGAKDLVSAVNKNAKTLGTAVADIAVLNNKYVALAGDLDIVKGDLANAKSELATAITNAKDELQGKIDDVQDNLDDVKAALLGYSATNDIKIAAIKNAATALETRVAKNEADIADLKSAVTTIQNTYAKTTEVKAAIDDAKASLDADIDDLRESIAQITGDAGYVEALRTSINALTESLNSVAETLSDHIVDYNSFKENVNNEINELWNQLNQTNQTIVTVLNTAQDQIDVLAGYSKQLKSLVFSPKEYYQGIEAIGIYSYNYTAYKELPAYDAEKDQIAANTPASSGKSASVVPDVTAEYYLNPSNATVDTDLSHYKFLVNNAKYTRAASASDITIKSVEKKDGKALITFGMKNASGISKIDRWASVSGVDVAALQYTYKSEESKNDTTITSDWAALKNYEVNNFTINKASAAGKTEEMNEAHLAATAKAAIAPNEDPTSTVPTLEIQYDNTEGIDLDQWINVHYNYDSNEETVWGGQKTVNEKGFKLVYSLVGYIAAGHDTNESAHAKLDGSKLTLQGYKGAEAGRQIIGRTPLVRVTLVDENTNKQIASVGYILVKITDKQIKPETVTADAINDKYTVKCEGQALNNVQAITWEEVENKVCAKLGVSKTEFEANWTFDGTNQYVQNAKGEFVVASATEKFGTVTKTTEDKGGHQTNVLKWTVSNGDAYTYFVTKGKTSKSIWVKFAPTKTTDTPVYVQLTWTPSAVNKTPEAEILNSADHKKAAAWHENFTELHVQPGNATVKGATCDYVNLVVANTFNVAPLDIVKTSLKATYPELAAAADVEYVFAPTSQQTTKSIKGLSGTTYTITSNGASIMANGTEIATISNDGIGTIGIVNTGVMQDIINSGKNLMTLTVLAKASTCAPAANLINFKNNKFDVRVITPLFVEGAVIKDMQLNNASTLTQPVTLKFTDFNAYTESQFLANSNNNVIFKNYYDIKSIKQVGTIMTNYSGAKKAVDENDFTITYKEGSLKTVGGVMTDMGSITLTQKNQSRNNGFKVWVPVEVTYKWGTVKTQIELDVQAASQAARRH